MKEPKTFTVEVPEIGTFTFRQRTMRDLVRIGAEYGRMTDGVEAMPAGISAFAEALSDLTVLTVSGPEGWNLDAMDPLDESSVGKVMRVFGALRDKETSFRNVPGKGSEGGGASAGG